MESLSMYPSGYERRSPVLFSAPRELQMPFWTTREEDIINPRTPFGFEYLPDFQRKAGSRTPPEISSRPIEPQPFIELQHNVTETDQAKIDVNAPFYVRPLSPPSHINNHEIYPRRTPPLSPPEPQYRQLYDTYPPHTSQVGSEPRSPPLPLRTPPPSRHPASRPPPPPSRPLPPRQFVFERRGPVVASSKRHGSHPPRVQHRKRQSKPRHQPSWERGREHGFAQSRR